MANNSAAPANDMPTPSPAPVPYRKEGVWTRLKKQKYLQLLMVLPVLYYIIFHYIPMYGVLVAFKDYRLRLGFWGSDWIGFTNFIRFFDNPYSWVVIKNTVLLSVYSLIWEFLAAITLALLLNELRSVIFKRVVQTVTYIPHFLSTAAVVGFVVLLLSPNSGLINMILGAFGIDPVYFMIKPEWFRTIYIGSSIWQNVGWGTIIYLAAIAGINPSLYEASAMDGASRWQNIRHITLPGISHAVIILLLLNVGNLISVSMEKILLMYNTQTYVVADVIGTYVYRVGLLGADYGYGSAIGLVNSVVNLILILIANALARRYSESSLW
ncbi:ABC transporter permease [Paenibacillus sp. 1P07SE]|uniref:ABC transporter permease n=1 Tax=Paenibacillus sp. 1P07SE TaxID=3132209 RepID=UPI0039A728F8